MFMLFVFFILFLWFTRLAMLAGDEFVGVLSTKKIILTIFELVLFFLIVFFTVNNRLYLEQTISKSTIMQKPIGS